MSAVKAAITPAKAQGRTSVGNGNRMFAGRIDHRTTEAKRFKEIVTDILVEVGKEPTESQIALARRAAVLGIWCEGQEALMVTGQPYDAASYTSASNALRRVFEALGLAQRDPKPGIDPLAGFLGVPRTSRARKAART